MYRNATRGGPSHGHWVHSRSLVPCGATIEAAAGMLIHSTALRLITTWPSAHPQCVCSVCRCCAATVIVTGSVYESLVLYICSAQPSCTFHQMPRLSHCYRLSSATYSETGGLFSDHSGNHLFSARPSLSSFLSDQSPLLMRYTLHRTAPSGPSPPTIPARSKQAGAMATQRGASGPASICYRYSQHHYNSGIMACHSLERTQEDPLYMSERN